MAEEITGEEKAQPKGEGIREICLSRNFKSDVESLAVYNLIKRILSRTLNHQLSLYRMRLSDINDPDEEKTALLEHLCT